MRKSYQETIELLRTVLDIVPDAIKYQKSIFKKYNTRSSMTYSLKRSNYNTYYDSDNIILRNDERQFLTITNFASFDDSIMIPEFNDIKFGVCDTFTSILLNDDYNKGDVYCEYNPKSKKLSYSSSTDDYIFDIKNSSDVDAALLQLMTIVDVYITNEELWGLISVLNDFYKVRSLRNKHIQLHVDYGKITPKHITNMVIPDEL